MLHIPEVPFLLLSSRILNTDVPQSVEAIQGLKKSWFQSFAVWAILVVFYEHLHTKLLIGMFSFS